MPATDIFSPAAPADATAGTPATDPALKSSDALHDTCRVFKVLLNHTDAKVAMEQNKNRAEVESYIMYGTDNSTEDNEYPFPGPHRFLQLQARDETSKTFIDVCDNEQLLEAITDAIDDGHKFLEIKVFLRGLESLSSQSMPSTDCKDWGRVLAPF
jgi:hypothetical protein